MRGGNSTLYFDTWQRNERKKLCFLGIKTKRGNHFFCSFLLLLLRGVPTTSAFGRGTLSSPSTITG